MQIIVACFQEMRLQGDEFSYRIFSVLLEIHFRSIVERITLTSRFLLITNHFLLLFRSQFPIFPWRKRIASRIFPLGQRKGRGKRENTKVGIKSGIVNESGRKSRGGITSKMCACTRERQWNGESRTGRGNGGFVTKAVWFNWSHPLVADVATSSLRLRRSLGPLLALSLQADWIVSCSVTPTGFLLQRIFFSRSKERYLFIFHFTNPIDISSTVFTSRKFSQLVTQGSILRKFESVCRAPRFRAERRGKTLWILSARACHECSRAVACGCGRLEKCMPLRWHLQTLERLSASHATPSPLVTSRRFILFFFLFHALIESNRSMPSSFTKPPSSFSAEKKMNSRKKVNRTNRRGVIHKC